MRRGREKKKHSDAGREEVKVERRSGMRWMGGGREEQEEEEVVVVVGALQEDDVMYLG